MWLSSCWAAVPLCRSPTPPLLALLLTAALVVALRLHAQPAGVQQTAALEASLAELPAGAMRRWFLNTTDPLAVCNDGTSAAYYFRPGSGSGASRWVIRFQGGGWCTDAGSCQQRMDTQPWLMSSTLYPEVIASGTPAEGIPDILAQPWGILAADPARNTAFHNWNHAYLFYCTSDSSLGDTAQGLAQGTQRWAFRGRRVVAALANHLAARQGLGNAMHVLVTGDSAGGVSALNNADFMLQRVKGSLHRLVTWKVYVDAGWFLDIPGFGATADSRPMRDIAMTLQTAYNASFDATCMAQLLPGQRWACFFGHYWWQHFPLPTFLGEFLYDSANLGFDSASNPTDDAVFRQAMSDTFMGPANATELGMTGDGGSGDGSGGNSVVTLPSVALPGRRLHGLGSRLQAVAARLSAAALAAQVNVGVARQPPSIYAEAVKMHEIIDNDKLFSERIGATRLYDALADWFLNGTRYTVVDGYPALSTRAQTAASVAEPVAPGPSPAAAAPGSGPASAASSQIPMALLAPQPVVAPLAVAAPAPSGGRRRFRS